MRLGRARRHSNTAGDELTARQANTPGPDRIAQGECERVNSTEQVRREEPRGEGGRESKTQVQGKLSSEAAGIQEDEGRSCRQQRKGGRSRRFTPIPHARTRKCAVVDGSAGRGSVGARVGDGVGVAASLARAVPPSPGTAAVWDVSHVGSGARAVPPSPGGPPACRAPLSACTQVGSPSG